VNGYVLRRLASIGPTLLAVALVVFAIFKFVPGDPARLLAGPDATDQVIAMIRHDLGLDQPLYVQFGLYIWHTVTGDLGLSTRTHQPVVVEVANRLPASATLALTGLLLAAVIGMSAGVLSAARPNSLMDRLISAGCVLAVCIPGFWIALVAVLVFAVQLGWLPSSGMGDWKNVVLPALSLGIPSAAIVARQAHADMTDVLRQDYVRTAMAKGLRERTVLLRHALKNATIPSVTLLGLEFGNMIGGAVVVETIFAWPGVGRLVFDSISNRDLPTAEGAILLLGAGFVIANLLVDLSYAYLDPRISYR
jgi:peptide/nickel transport system permease protein